MLHSQLKVKYPDSPFMWDYTDMTNTFQFTQTTVAERNELITHVIDIIVADEEKDADINNIEDVRNAYIDRDNIDFLIKLTDPEKVDSVYDSIDYTIVEQKIPKIKRDMWINFHTAAYCKDNGGILSKEYDSNVAWCVVPIIGDVYPTSTRNYSLDTRSKEKRQNDTALDNDAAKASKPAPYTGNIDNRFDKIEENVSAVRTSRRNFVKRSDPAPLVAKKTDIMTNSVNKEQYVQPRIRQIELNKNTRASGSLIRERLSSPYKMNRIKFNPELYKQQMRVDLSLRSVAENVADAHNRRIDMNNPETIVDRERYDFIHDQVRVHKVGGILRFSPITSGRLKFNHTARNKELCFVTVLRHKTYLHITLHHIELC